MMERELPQDLLSRGCQEEQDFAPVFAIALPLDITLGSQPVHELYGAMVLNLQSFGQFSDTRPHASGQAFQSQHELMLAGLQSRLARRSFAEAKKAPYLMPQFGQSLEIRLGSVLSHFCDSPYRGHLRPIMYRNTMLLASDVRSLLSFLPSCAAEPGWSTAPPCIRI
jgi:hypothetical protein